MKHSSRITLLLVVIFLITQVMGLLIVNQYIDHRVLAKDHIIEWSELPLDFERPTAENESVSFIPIMIALLIGTGMVFLLIRFNLAIILKIWFFVVIVITLSFAFGSALPQYLALACALLLAFWKMLRPNIFIHNITELFIYGGLAAIFVPMLNIFSAFMLLVVISIYDMIAVWHTKHMVKLARFQADSKVFSGLFIPYGGASMKSASLKEPSKKEQLVLSKVKTRVAVLGGGDMGFPLIFAGVILKAAMLESSVQIAFLKTLLIPLCASIALYILLMKGEKNKFYPAMPFLSIGCLVGYLLFLLF